MPRGDRPPSRTDRRARSGSTLASRRARGWTSYLLAAQWVTILAGLAATVTVAWIARDEARRDAGEALEAEARQRGSAIRGIARESVLIAESLRLHVEGAGEAGLAGFASVAQGLLDARPQIRAVAWAPLEGSGRCRVAIREGREEGALRQGWDLNGEPVVRSALDRARQERGHAATAGFTAPDGLGAVLVLAYVSPPDAVREHGIVAVEIAVPELLRKALAQAPNPGIACRLADTEDGVELDTLTATEAWAGRTSRWTDFLVAEVAPTREFVRIGDRTWVLEVSTDREHAREHFRSLLALAPAAALVLSALASLYVRRLAEERARMEALVARRTSELRESEVRFREMADLIPVIVVETSPVGRICYANRLALAELGYSNEDLLHGLNLADAVRPDERTRAVTHLAEVSVTGADGEGRNYIFARKDGTWFHGLARAAPIVREGAFTGLRVVVTNVSPLVEAEAERAALQEQLHRAQHLESLGVLAGGVAHDFNNMLTVILGRTRFALDRLPPESLEREDLRAALLAAVRARDVVRRVLIFSRKAEAEQRVFDLADMARDALALLRASLPATIEIRESYDTEGVLVEGDPTQLHQVVVSLCTNAAQAMGEGGGVLGLSVIPLEVDGSLVSSLPGLEPGPCACITVSDTGIGMSEAVRARIFDPFFTTKPPGEGTGLGLSLTHGAVLAHRGAISCESVEGLGTTFRVYLPRVTRIVLEEAPPRPSDPRGAGQTILVVDDEDAVRDLVAEQAAMLGYSALRAASAREAMRIIRSGRKDIRVVLTDYTMPEMTGLQLADEIAQTAPMIPVLLMSGFAPPRDEETARIIRGVLEKPFDLSELAHALATAMEIAEAALVAQNP